MVSPSSPLCYMISVRGKNEKKKKKNGSLGTELLSLTKATVQAAREILFLLIAESFSFFFFFFVCQRNKKKKKKKNTYAGLT